MRVLEMAARLLFFAAEVISRSSIIYWYLERGDEDMYFNEINEYVNMIYSLLESGAREYNRK